MSNVHSINDNHIPSNPAMAEAFKEAAIKSSPEIGGDTLQAESHNMTQRSESSTHHYAKVMADMTSPKGKEAMHETNGEDAQMFSEVKEMAEPAFTGSHGLMKRQAIAAVAAVAGTALVYGVMTGDTKRTQKAVAVSVGGSLFNVGYYAAKKALKKQSPVIDQLDTAKITVKEAIGIAALNMGLAAVTCAAWIGLTKKSETTADTAE